MKENYLFKTMYYILKIIRGFCLVLSIFTFILAVMYLFSDIHAFELKASDEFWTMTYRYTNKMSHRINLPINLISSMPVLEYQVKFTLILYLLGKSMMGYIILSMVCKNINQIIDSHQKQIYTSSDVITKSCKKLSVIVLIYLTFSDVIVSLLYKIMMQTFYFNPGNLHLSGLVFGSILYLIAELYHTSSKYYERLS